MRRPYSDRYAAAIGASMIACWILAGCATALRVAGWHTLAGIVGLATLPIAVFGVAATGWLFPKFVAAMAAVRRERAEAEKSAGGDGCA
ncbi:hypothetical protein [Phytohabitans houttuyneae]|uniref:Lipoprotein n=1 Tax=Phytohabitans houttuyneae TaxID=1076126 RepID=A0A6V8KBM7_9ACTN|nr:hypothetical protein [Phytohabitans houttuyneae]GFJ79549.1 hypothetical protein Phou_037290 [Phytohabitans houttuyneae]